VRLVTIAVVLLVPAALCRAGENTPPSGHPGLTPDEIQQGFVSLFDGSTLAGWQGAVDGYAAESGILLCKKDGGGFLFSQKEYADFVLRLEYKLEPGGNNGVAIRTPICRRPARKGMEIQILDDRAPQYQKLLPEQLCGSIYGAVAARPGHTRPPGQWNALQITARGSRVRVKLNGAVVVDADTDTLGRKTIHGWEVAGLANRKGHLAFCGHHHRVEFRNIRIRQLDAGSP